MGSRVGQTFGATHGRLIEAAIGSRPKVSSLATELRELQGILTDVDRTALFAGFANNAAARDTFAQALGASGMDLGRLQCTVFGLQTLPGSGSVQPRLAFAQKTIDLLSMAVDSEKMPAGTAAQLLSPRQSIFTAFAVDSEESGDSYLRQVADVCCGKFPYAPETLSDYLRQASIPYEVYSSESLLRTLFGFRESFYSGLIPAVLAGVNPSKTGRIFSAPEFPTDGAAIALEEFHSLPAGRMSQVFGAQEIEPATIVEIMNGQQARIMAGRGTSSVWDMWARALSAIDRAKAESVFRHHGLSQDVAEIVLLHPEFDEALALELI